MLKKRQGMITVVALMCICMVFTVVPVFVFAAPEAGAEEALQEPGVVSENDREVNDRKGVSGQEEVTVPEETAATEENSSREEAAAPEEDAGEKTEEVSGMEGEAGDNTEESTGQGEDEGEAEKPKAVMLQSNAAAAAAKSVSVGEKISYTGKRVGKVDQTTIFTYKDTSRGLTFTGTCRQAGIPMDKSGTGTIESRISNTSKIAKVLYLYAVQKDWLTGKDAATNARKVLGLNYEVGFTYRRLIESACQIHSMGKKAFKKAMMNVGGVSEPTVDAICDWYSNLDVSKVTVPDEFEAYQVATASGVQPFTMWVLKDTPVTPPPAPTPGFVTLKKVSGNESLTGGGNS